MAAILKREVRETYDVTEKVETQFGLMPSPKRKGEGGASSLVKRIADNFHNRFMRWILLFLD